jgi:hypothetical protein
MLRFSPKRSLLIRLLRSLGPPPPPPRRHFSKDWGYGGQYRPGAGRHGGRNGSRYRHHGGSGSRGGQAFRDW